MQKNNNNISNHKNKKPIKTKITMQCFFNKHNNNNTNQNKIKNANLNNN